MRLLRGLLLVIGLSGCASSGSQALIDAFHYIRAGTASHENSSRLDPRFKYLRVQVGQREVFLVLGEMDAQPDGPVEVWYSGTGEVLRLRDGHLAGADMNFASSWQSVSFTDLPRWNRIGAQAAFERSRDVSPGYQYGIKERMVIRHIAPPGDSQLKLLPVSSLTWFEERAEVADALPPARYGVSMAGAVPQVEYAEQCTSNDFCFSWQRWSPANGSGY